MYFEVIVAMKMNLLQDILKGLEALERKEQVTTLKPKQIKSTGFGKLINVTREPSRGPAGEPVTSDPYTVDYPPQSYDYDPDQIVFFQVQLGSPEHQAKLNDFDLMTKCDPTTAHKILTLA